MDPGVWVVVGLSSNDRRAAFHVSRWLHVELGKPIIPVHPKAETVHGAQGYASLADIPDQDVKVIDCFVELRARRRRRRRCHRAPRPPPDRRGLAPGGRRRHPGRRPGPGRRSRRRHGHLSQARVAQGAQRGHAALTTPGRRSRPLQASSPSTAFGRGAKVNVPASGRCRRSPGAALAQRGTLGVGLVAQAVLERGHRGPQPRAPARPRPDARIRTASSPALRAPPIDTVATGTPAGICTIDSSESIPSR